MSFDALIDAKVIPKKEAVKVKSGDKELTFYANEMTYFERLKLAEVKQNGGNIYVYLTAMCITDEAGNRMTLEQAEKLPQEFGEVFFFACTRVNTVEQDVETKN